MYSVSEYGSMITDSVRMTAYEQALRAVVSPEKVILDIGAGTGIFSLLACQMGARHVYAIEPDDALEVARDIARIHGYNNRITFIQELSTQVNLPERMDVIISDLRGVLPLYEQNIPAIVDARERFLKPDGILIPQEDTIWAAVVTSPQVYKPCVTPWLENPYGLDMQAGHAIVVNNWHRVIVKPEELLSEPQMWTRFDYRTISNPDVSETLTWVAQQPGTGHGLVVWFDTKLIDSITFSNSPDSPELVYGMFFIPWQAPVDIEAGDIIIVDLAANLVSGEYVLKWNTQVAQKDSNQPLKANFRQSTFYGSPLSSQLLKMRADHFVPSLNETGQLDSMILGFMKQDQSLGSIAVQVFELYPNRFKTWEQALAYIGNLSVKYAR